MGLIKIIERACGILITGRESLWVRLGGLVVLLLKRIKIRGLVVGRETLVWVASLWLMGKWSRVRRRVILRFFSIRQSGLAIWKTSLITILLLRVRARSKELRLHRSRLRWVRRSWNEKTCLVVMARRGKGFIDCRWKIWEIPRREW